MGEEMFSRKNAATTAGIAADFREAMERLELGDYARGIARQAETKLGLPPEFAGSFEVPCFEIDDIASDNHRAQKAIRNGLDSDAKWSDIEAVARAQSRSNLGLPESADLGDIVDARRKLAREVLRRTRDGSLDELDWRNPEVQFGAKLCIQYDAAQFPKIVSVIQERPKVVEA